jgi:hypothetical protein
MGDGNNEKRKAAFHAIVGRALTDTTFREGLRDTGKRQSAVSDLLQGTGVQYSEISEDLEAAISAVEKLAGHFDPDLRAAS